MARRFSVEAVFQAVDQVTRPVARMQGRVGRFTRSFGQGLRRVDRWTQRVNRTVGTHLKNSILAVSGAVTSLVGSITMLNRASVATDRLAESVGVSVQMIESLSAAVSGAGFDESHIVDLIEEMNNKLGESAGLEAITPVNESLQILGLRFQEIKNLSPEEQFRRIADAALAMSDQQQAAAAMDVLMGGEANRLIGVLRQQGGSIEDITSRYGELNARTAESRQGARDFIEAWDQAKFALMSLGSEIAGLLGEDLIPLIERVKEYVSTNKDLIKTRVLDWFERLQDNLGRIVTWMKRIGIAIAVWWVFISVLKTVIAVMTVVNLVMAMNPLTLMYIGIVLASAAIAALITWLIRLVQRLGFFNWIAEKTKEAWGMLKGFFVWLWDNIVAAFRDGSGTIQSIISGVGEFIQDPNNPINRGFESLADKIQDPNNPVNQAFEWTVDQIGNMFTAMFDWVVDKLEWVAQKVRGVAEFLNLVDEEADAAAGGGGGGAGGGGGGASFGVPSFLSQDDEDERGGSSFGPPSFMVSPGDRTARSIEEMTRTERTEVVIRDDSGRAEVAHGPRRTSGFQLTESGAY